MPTVASTRQLFVDDHIVEEMAGLRRTMHQPEKRGHVLRAEEPWEGVSIAVFAPPMWIPEEGIYKQVYECRYQEDGIWGKRYALATSRDGILWEKPHLGLVAFDGSKHNNLFPTPDDQRMVHVVYDPDDPDASRRYKGLLTVSRGRVPVVSGDCVRWQKLDAYLPSGDAGTMTFDREQRLFMALLKRPNPSTVGRSYDVSFSRDFVEWSEPRFIFGMDKDRDQEMALDIIRSRLANPALAKPLFVDPDPALGWRAPAWRDQLSDQAQAVWRTECYNFGVVPYEGLYLGLITAYYATGTALPEKNNTDGFNLIQLAVSRDLREWHRLGDRHPFLGPSPLTSGLIGNYDRLQLGAYNGAILHGDQVRVYYDGMKRRVPQHDRWLDGTPRDSSTLTDSERADWLEDTHSAMCLAVLRRDGFVSLDAGEDGGYVLTKTLKVAGSNLFLNLDAPQGAAQVEVLEAQGQPIAVFAGNNAISVSGDGVRVPVRWFGGEDISLLAGRTVRLRIHLQQGSLYAFWAE